MAVLQTPIWTGDREDWERNKAALGEELEAIKEAFSDNVRANRLPAEIALRKPTAGQEFRTERVQRALLAIRLDKLQDEDRGWLLSVIEVALGWTVERYEEDRRRGDSPPFEWTAGFGEWLGGVLGLLSEEESEHVLGPLRASWPATAAVTANVIYGFTAHHLASNDLAESTKERWRSIVGWVIPTEPLPADPRLRRDRDELDALGLVMHVRSGRGFVTAEWEHVEAFVDVYQRWVDVAGHHHWGFRVLLAFSRAAGMRLPATQIVSWFAETLARAKEKEELWREQDTGGETAERLSSLWATSETEIHRDDQVLSKFMGMVDELVRAGVPLAAELRRLVIGAS